VENKLEKIQRIIEDSKRESSDIRAISFIVFNNESEMRDVPFFTPREIDSLRSKIENYNQDLIETTGFLITEPVPCFRSCAGLYRWLDSSDQNDLRDRIRSLLSKNLVDMPLYILDDLPKLVKLFIMWRLSINK